MDNKKSLGSTPIGYDVNPTSYSFIRDLGVSEKKARTKHNGEEAELKDQATKHNITEAATIEKDDDNTSEKQPSEKKIVSYYLEIELVDRLKEMADKQGSYYSAVVSRAIQAWIEHNDY